MPDLSNYASRASLGSESIWPLFGLSLLGVGCVTAVVTYRLFLSPLANIPGDKLAAITTWYNGYFDVVLGGQYVFAIEEMHRKYGPVVRTRPDAVHIDDPYFIDTIYSQSTKQRRERAWTFLSTTRLPGSILATASHELHRQRRAVLSPFFSQQNVRQLGPVINDVLSNLLRRMDGWAETGEVVKLSNPFLAASKDIIQAYGLGDGTRYLDMEDCNKAFFEVMQPGRVTHLGTYFYSIMSLLHGLPPALMKKIMPTTEAFIGFFEELEARIHQIKDAKELPEGRTIFHEILSSDVPESEKSVERLAHEAAFLLLAGTETTAYCLCVLVYHLLSDKTLLSRLKEELAAAMPDPEDFLSGAELDQLPFLNALIQEALRLYPGACHRQDRVAPDEDLIYRSPNNAYTYLIPAGTTIGMAASTVNKNPSFYTRSAEFWPDRYLENPSLRKYNMSFSKGTRQCLGINLAYYEIQVFVAGIFRRYDVYDPFKIDQGGPTMELYETAQDAITMHADYIVPAFKPGTKGVRVRIRA